MIVLMSPGKSEKDNNKYIDLLRENIPTEVNVENFSYFKALFKRYEILHVHWPERLYRAGGRLKTIMKRALFTLLVLRIILLRTRVIWTVHDKLPHEKLTRIESFLNSAFRRCVKSKIYLQNDPDFNGERDFIIKHGNYRQEAAIIESGDEIQKTSVVCIGFLRPSKNVESLFNHFPTITEYHLRISGQPISTSYGESLHLLAEARPDITLNTHRLTTDQLKDAYSDSFCSIIPYKNTYNSGAALFSLSIPRPVIATESITMLDLQHEVGSHWLQLIPQNFRSEDIRFAIENLSRAKSQRDSVSPLSGERDWKIIGNQHLAAYRKNL